jgi:acetyltransferase
VQPISAEVRVLREPGIAALFEPNGVAVIGSMREGGGQGWRVIDNMRRFGFSGGVYPISRSQGLVHGMRAYPSVSEVNDPIDLAVIITPPDTVTALVDECGRRGIRAGIVVSEGFAESGPDGVDLQRMLVSAARRRGMRLLGPNTLGILNNDTGLITEPYYIGTNKPLPGGICYCSQTGVLTFGNHPIKDRPYPICKICDFGNKCDVNESDMLDYLAADPATRVIAMHLEDVKDGQRFVRAARQAAAVKPVLIFKPGQSGEARTAVSSHTGSLAGDDQAYEASFKQAGAIRLRNSREFWEIPRALASQPLARGRRIAVVTATGGAGIMLLDAANEAGLVPASFTADTLRLLEAMFPRFTRNPVDVGPVQALRLLSFFGDPVPVVLADANVDCAVVASNANADVVNIWKDMLPQIKRIGKPVTVFGFGYDLAEMEDCARRLQEIGVPMYFDMEMAVKALAVGAACSEIRSGLVAASADAASRVVSRRSHT